MCPRRRSTWSTRTTPTRFRPSCRARNKSNIEVKVADDILTIKGEKKEEKEEKDKNYYMSERRYGSFQRSFQLPPGVDQGKIDASFQKGVLTVTLPKSPEAQQKEKKIVVKAK